MVCSYETANRIIQNNKKSTVTAVTTPKSHLNDRERNCKHLLEKQFQYNNSKLNQQPTRNLNNDNCQFERVQQSQNLAATNTASTTKANETSSKTITKIYKLNNDGNESYKATGDSSTNKEIIEITALNLQAKNYKDRNNYKILGETTRFAKAEKAYVPALQGFCINCYPIACHNRYCCEEQHKQQHKQQPQLVVDKITNQSRPTLKPSNYIKSNKSRSCSNNSYCRCHLSYFYPKHTKNTVRNEQQCVPNLRQCKCIANQANGFATFANVHSANGHWLQKTLSHASTSLTANALDLKNNLMGVMANCAIVAESLKGINTLFIKNCLSNCTVSNQFNTNNHNNSKNHKPEPYRGYSYRVNHLPDNRNCTTCSSSTISYTSKPSTSISNSCSLHNATSPSCRCIENNQYAPNNSNNNNKNMKRFNKSYSNAHNYHSYSVPHSAGFSYIGQNYYSFLRQTINFYTASSVILVLCYLTSTTSAATTKSGATTIDKHPIFDESSSDKEILDLLLEKKRYDKRLLPPVNDEDFCCGLSSPDMASEIHSRRPHKRGTLTVNVNVLLLSLASPDESSLKYEVEFLLNQQWNDPRLQYGNKSHYDFLNALHHHDSIWTPDTYFIMHGDFKDPIIPMHFALRIYRNGTITYAMRRHLILSCQGSLHIFPFDDPKCSFSMESISYEEAQIKYIWKNDEDTLRKSPSLTTLNAYLIKNQTTACDQNSWRGNYSCLRVDLIFTRDRAFYFTTVFIPGIILVTSSFITFWLEWNAVPARSMIGVTTMLNFFTTSNGFRSTLPVVSNLTAMNVWDGVCMCFIYASLLEFVCVNYMGRKRPQHNVVYRPGENPVTQPGEKKRDAAGPNEIVACTTCGGSSGSPCTHSVNNGCATETCFVQVRKKEPPHPIRIAKTIDVIARITFPVAYSIFLIFFFVHYKGFS